MKSPGAAAALASILIASFLLKLHHLDHAAVKPLDEVFHAIVARNFLKHPLTPTLVDLQFLPNGDRDWLTSHIWLHKPPLALWQIAISFACLGVNTLALRLPSAILSTLAVWLTYLIGKNLLDRTAALIAAALQAFNPVILMLVHGYVFSDHVDISLLFWTELSILFLIRALRPPPDPTRITQSSPLLRYSGGGQGWGPSPRRPQLNLPLCGIAQGLAFLSKTYPALIVTILAVAAWLLPAALRRRDQPRLTAKGVLAILLFTALTALPWLIYAALRFPQQFANEQLNILHHLNENVEGWAAPWDRLAFGYWISIFYVYYPAIIAAGIIVFVRACQTRQTGPWMILVWTIGVMIPNLLATSKTMSATLIAWPAAWLLLGYLISLALHGDKLALGAWLVSMLLAVASLHPHSIPAQGWGYEPGGFAIIMRQHLWVVWHVLASVAAGVALTYLPTSQPHRSALAAISATAMLFLFGCWWKTDHPPSYLRVAWDVTQIDAQTPTFSTIGSFAARLPPNAAFLVDEQKPLDNKLIEFAADRSCYALARRDWRGPARELATAGALPYLITSSPQPLPVVLIDGRDNETIYACTPAARDAAP